MSAPVQITLGVLVMVSGIIISLPPGIPGFFITLAGLGIIAARSHRVARALDRTELGARRWWRRLRDSHRKP